MHLNRLLLPYLILGIEMLGSLVIINATMRAWLVLMKKQRETARLIIAEGAVNGLSFKLGAALLKTLYLHSWSQIGMLVVIVSLRMVLKQLFTWEQRKVQRSFSICKSSNV